MKRRLPHAALLLALATPAGCGTEIDAEESSAEMAAALSLDALRLTTDAGAQSSEFPGSRVASPAMLPAASPATSPAASPAGNVVFDGLLTTLYAEHDVEVSARTMGTVRSVRAELGDRVEAGAMLAVLDDAIERAAVAAADAELELVRAEYARVELLTGQGGMTTAELEQARYRLRSGEAAYDDAVARLEQRHVRAPFAGHVSRRFVQLGEFVEEGDPLFRVTALRPLRALVRVPELAAHEVRPGGAITLRALDGREVAGRVMRVSPAIDPASGTVEVMIDVPDPDGLRPGATVTARIARE